MYEERGRVLERAGMGQPAEHRSLWRRVRSWLRVRSLAGQVFVAVLLVVLLLVAAALSVLVLQARDSSVHEAEQRTRAAAIAFAHSPGAVTALDGPNPSAALRSYAEDARKSGGFAYVTFFSPKGIGYTFADPSENGTHVYGPYKEAFKGPYTYRFDTPDGSFMDTTAPVVRPDGSVAGFVAVGVTPEQEGQAAKQQLPILLGAAALALVVGTGGAALVGRRLRHQTHGLGPVELTRMYEHHDAVLHAVREGVLIIGGELGGAARVLLANDEARRLLDLPDDVEGKPVTELGLAPEMAELLVAGRAATDEVHLAGDRLLALNIRLTEPFGGLPGSVATIRDTTEMTALAGRADVARARLDLLYDAATRVGTTLDVAQTARELAEVAVPRFADFVTVELADAVLHGDEPPPDVGMPGGPGMRRTAMSGIRDDAPLSPLGSLIDLIPTAPQDTGAETAHAVLSADLHQADLGRAGLPEKTDEVLAYGIHSLTSAPLTARGVILGVVNFWRSGDSEPFAEDDLSVAEELAARAAICVDNARRYTREHTMVETLQQSLLPSGLPEQGALDLAYCYLPALHGVGGDWFDVIPLSGFRVALVVGDVVGHGLHAAATMGRLRTAVLNFSALDLPPDELIARLDELVTHLDQGDGASVTGATCLYAIYDPVSGDCTMARAGHPLPALVRPDDRVEFVDLPAGLPLGVGGLPFEAAQLRLQAGTQLVLYTDGLVSDRDRDMEDGLATLRACLADTRADGSPEHTCKAVLDATAPTHPLDDIMLLVARTNLLEPGQVTTWDVPPDPAAVSRIRSGCAEQLTAWGLEHLTFTTELILSELITNAIRYGTEPIRVRMLRDRSLVCEVSDGSSTAPHLRYAATTDEGGRGLFLVAQLSERWGTRYTARGKVIWCEQPLTATPEQLIEAMLL
ncbi:SpoIIE family protein phosphatase [Streptomyces sp. NPDC059460]|uniref:SpoIIE family protein phosphatase n=1 Tax=Streptomyces sp. NPDC059460 TaxID=3346840 RepID=UPI0036C47E4C